jgi:hypothetical protein
MLHLEILNVLALPFHFGVSRHRGHRIHGAGNLVANTRWPQESSATFLCAN